jgi:hypothetical protein
MLVRSTWDAVPEGVAAREGWWAGPSARAEPLVVPPDFQCMSKVVNAPTTPNTGGYELRVGVSKPVLDRTAGQNSGGYELRVTQEAGTH